MIDLQLLLLGEEPEFSNRYKYN